MEANQLSKFWFRLTVFLFSLLLIVIGYYVVFSNDYGLIAQRKLNNQLQTQLTDLTTQVNTLKDKQQILNYQIERVTQKQTYLESSIATYSSVNKLKIADLNALLSTANKSLVLYNDVENSFRLLSVASNLIATESGADFESLRVSIGHDIDQLQQTQVVSNLTLITQNINQIRLLESQLIKKTAVDSSSSTGFWHGLSSLIQIRKISKQDKNNSVVSDFAIINQINMKLSIDLITMALMIHNQALWMSN